MFQGMAIRHNQERQRSIYKTLYAKHRCSHRSLHWSDPVHQWERFRILSQIGELKGRKILDIGCGLGDFFSYLQQERIHGHFVGFDIVEEFLSEARERHPKIRFEHCNVLSKPLTEKFDYVFASGVYAFGNRTFFQALTKEAFRLAKHGYAFNLYHSRYDRRFFRFSQEEIYTFCKSLEPRRIVVKKNYLDDDTTFFLYK